MKGKKLLTLIGSVCLILVLAAMPFLAACPAPAEEEPTIELSYAIDEPSVGATAEFINWWADEVNKRTGGAVTIKVYWGGSLATAMEITDAVRTGTVDIGDMVWGPYFPEKFPLREIGDYPIPFLDHPLAFWKASEQLQEEFPEFNEELAANNMKELTYYGVANIHVISRKPLRSLEDFEGLKVRCAGPLHTKLLEAVGAVPMFKPSVEAFDALQKGVMDASTCTARWSVDYHYNEVAKYFTQIGLGGDANMGAMINLDVWNELPESVQQVFMELREEFPAVVEETYYKWTLEDAYPALEEAGVEIIDLPQSDIETWKSLPVCEELRGEWTQLVLEVHPELSQSRVDEILSRYLELYAQFRESARAF